MASTSTAPATPAINLLKLIRITDNSEELLQHLQRWGLIPTEGTYKCPTCGNSLKLQRKEDRIDGWLWQCNHKVSLRKQKASKCGTRVEFRRGTFFARSKLSLLQILGFVNFWVKCIPQAVLAEELELSERTAADWASFCREVCLEYFMHRPTKLGGLGSIVEIYESKFGGRKYHRGHRIEGQQVFGFIERDTGRAFMVSVEQGDTDTLLPVIEQWIEPSTTIISDYWKAYDVLHLEGYQHLKVNHSVSFRDPERTARTNAIESSWLTAKTSTTASGRLKAHVPGNLARYMFLKRCLILQLDRTIEFFRLAGELYNPVVDREDFEEERSDDGAEEDF